MVLKLVSIPPASADDVGHAAAHRLLLDRIPGRALGADEQHFAAPGRNALMKVAACAYRGCVFSKLMMWILFRSPKMKGAIFGFQKRV